MNQEPLAAALDRAVAQYGDALCDDFLDRHYSYGEIGRLVDRAARGLQDMGVRKGDRVELFLPNSPYFVIFYYAISKVGGIIVNFNPLYAEEEVCRQVRDSGTRILVTMDLKLLLPKAARALEETGLEQVVVCPMAAALPPRKRILFSLFRRQDLTRPPKSDAFVWYAQLIANAGNPDPVAIDPVRDIAVLQYTGGTTGISKGAMLSHANLTANRAQVTACYPGVRIGEERVLGVLPLFHVFAMTVVMNFSVGVAGAMVLLPRFDLTEVLKTIHKKRPDKFPVVPTLLNAINQCPTLARYDLSSLSFCISGGAPLPVEVKHAFEGKTGCVVVEGYGLSEASPVCTCNPVDGRAKDASIGGSRNHHAARVAR